MSVLIVAGVSITNREITVCSGSCEETGQFEMAEKRPSGGVLSGRKARRRVCLERI